MGESIDCRELFTNCRVANAVVEGNRVTVVVIHKPEPDTAPAIFEMYIDRIANFLEQCRAAQRKNPR